MIGGAGFARMAWALAQSRNPLGSKPSTAQYYMPRERIEALPPGGSFPVHREYYAILDNALGATPERPSRMERRPPEGRWYVVL